MPRSRARTLPALPAMLVAAAIATGACTPLGPTPGPSETILRPSGLAASATPLPTPPPDEPFEAASHPAVDVDCAAGSVDGRPYRGLLRRVTAVDPRTVIFGLCQPDPAFLSRLASPVAGINDAAWLDAMADDRLRTSVNGTGPYRLGAWEPGRQLVLHANPDWRGGPPLAATVVVTWVPDAAARFTALAEGRVDGIDGVRPGDARIIATEPSLRLVPREQLGTVYLGFAGPARPFDSLRVRQAIAMGIDRAAIVEAAMGSSAVPATHVEPCSMPASCAGAPWYEHDRPRALALLEQAGVGDGFATVLHVPDAPTAMLPDPSALGEAVAAGLADLGITVTVTRSPLATLREAAAAGTLEGIHVGVIEAPWSDPSAILDPLVGPSARLFAPVPADLAAALAEGAGSTVAEAREAAYGRADDLLRTLVPVVPLTHTGGAVAFRSDVAGDLLASPLGLDALNTVGPGNGRQLVWAQATEPGGLACADEGATDALRICALLVESLYGYAPGTADPVPALAERCTPDATLALWTCRLRDDVRFHNGATLDANDVVRSFAQAWDPSEPGHLARPGLAGPFATLFGGLLPAR